jgi:P-type Ca2+ transporter type 2C
LRCITDGALVGACSKGGTAISILTFIALVAMIWVREKHPSRNLILKEIVEAFIIAITIIVVAIPEGLPLAVTM